jgi:predicted dehydrogenase
MAKKKELRIGLIGCGFMGRTHSNGYNRIPNFFPDLEYQPVLKVACSRNENKASAFAAQWGYGSFETDWKAVIAREDIDAIDICTPNDMHAEIAIAAAAAGKMVLTEKPLARNFAEGKKMVEAVNKTGVKNTVWYNYRRIPAVTLAKQIIDSGKLGKIFHYRANFLQDWTINADLPQGGEGLWRMDAAVAGSGVTGDLLAHCIDTAMWLNGGIMDVSAVTETFIKERYHQLTGKMEKVSIDDACAFLCHFSTHVGIKLYIPSK